MNCNGYCRLCKQKKSCHFSTRIKNHKTQFDCNTCLDYEVKDNKGKVIRECPKHYADLDKYVREHNIKCPYVNEFKGE